MPSGAAQATAGPILPAEPKKPSALKRYKAKRAVKSKAKKDASGFVVKYSDCIEK
jgi:hypothetical protein